VATTAAEWKASNRKEVETPSGKKVVIKKLVQRDFFPRRLANVGIDLTNAEDVKKYVLENLELVLDKENEILVKAIVEPIVSLSEGCGDDVIWVNDIEDADRKFLLKAIAEWSGASKEKQEEVDSFRRKQLAGAGADGAVLREAPVGAPGPDAR